MDEKFGNRFRIKSGRLKNWDYSSPGIYFVTICTLNKNSFFGEIIDGRMKYSVTGNVVFANLRKIEMIYPFVKIKEMVVMPNHVHILMKINLCDKAQKQIKVETELDKVETRQWHVSTKKSGIVNQIGKRNNVDQAIKNWKGRSLGSIINQYKMSCTKQIRKENLFFAWQTRYYDEIIMDNSRYVIVKNYIKNNLINWEKDKLNKNK